MDSLRTQIQRFVHEDTAAISVETVIIMPILVWFYAASFVFFDAYRSYNITIKASYAIGDILSRQTRTVTSADIDGLNELFKHLAFTDTGVWTRVTEVERTASGHSVVWSYATTGSQDNMVDADLPAIAFKIPNLDLNERIMLVETFTPYTPAFNVGINQHVWDNFVVTRPRFASHLDFDDLTT